jgi:hypothetical protein
MGGMWPTKNVMAAYSEAKAGVPKAVADVNTLLAKASGVSASLARHGITLTVPVVGGRATTTSESAR